MQTLSRGLAILLFATAACSGSTIDVPDGGPSPDAGPIDAAEPDATVVNTGPIAAQLNDVSILYPMPNVQADLDQLIAAAAAGQRGALLPKKLHDMVNTLNPHYAALHVIALRLDPCFAALAPDPTGANCTPQLRLVMQNINILGGDEGGNAQDFAMHVFYQLGREDFLELAQALVALRVANSSAGERLGALAPHPILARQAFDGAMATGLRALILKYAGQTNITRITLMGRDEGPSTWTFAGFDVQDATKALFRPLPIPTLAANTTSQQVAAGPGQNSINMIALPLSNAPDAFGNLTNGVVAMGLSASARQLAVDALARVDSPSHNSPNTMDCVSCHVATPTMKLIVAPLLSLSESSDAFAFSVPASIVPASEMTPTFSNDNPGDVNFHAFSYDGANAGVSQRVVNETAAVVSYLNQLP